MPSTPLRHLPLAVALLLLAPSWMPSWVPSWGNSWGNSWAPSWATVWAPSALAAQVEELPINQPERPAEAPEPELAASVRQLLDSSYLTEEERRELRVFHGIWTDEDIQPAPLRAQAALITGRIDDDVFQDPDTPALDRADAALQRGEFELALNLTQGAATFRAIRIRADALESLGRLEDAVKELEPVLAVMANEQLEDPEKLTEGVRCLELRAEILGQERAGGADHRVMMGLLARARDLDKLYWPARLLEAQLLLDKDNTRDARGAAIEALRLNPRSAHTTALLGRMNVDVFDFDRAEAIADRLDELVTWQDEPDDREGAAASHLGALLLASARLRQNDPIGATIAIAVCAERFPTMPRMLAMRAAIAAEEYDFNLAQRILDELDEVSPGTHIGYLTVGKTVSENRQYPEAAEFLEEAARRRPLLPEPYIELGLLEMQSGRDIRALDALTKAQELDPFHDRAANSLTLITELLTYETIESEHFVIRFREGIDRILATEMLPVLERIHERVCGDERGGIDHEPDRKTVIELMPDHRWFAVRITGMPGIHTIAAATGPVIAMERPMEGPGHSVGHYDWARVIQHEYTHTVTLSRTRNRIPHWFTEAAAVYLEDTPRDYRRAQLLAGALRSNSLFTLRDINIKFVRPEKPTDRAQAYAQGHWMYEYIVQRWGANAPLELMDLYAIGLREDEAFPTVLGISSADFFDDFKAWAEDEVRSWGLLPPEGQPSLRTLARELHAETQTPQEALSEPSAATIALWLEAHPNHPDVLEAAVKDALEKPRDQTRDAQLVDLLERYAKARPVDDMPHRHLASRYLESDTPNEAIPHLEFLDAREQHSAAYAVALTRRYAATGDWEKAKAKATRAVQIAPFDADMRELAATVALRMNDYDEAERQILALIEIEPDREIHQRRLEALRQMRG
jgi:tetratricopeptide (TPR) repeat protein